MAYWLLVALGLPVAWFLVPHGMRKLAERRLAARCRAEGVVVLSYDDGPDDRVTGRLLDLLKARGARATFFALGTSLAAHPDLARRLLAEGHEMGSHTHDHSNAWKTSPVTAARDLAAGRRAVAAAGGTGRFFRPPFGKLTLAGLVHGALAGLRYGWWTVDSRDSWAQRPPEDVLAEIEAKAGGVVLMHDADRYPAVPGGLAHPDYVLTLTERVIDLAEARGWAIRPLGEFIGAAEAAR